MSYCTYAYLREDGTPYYIGKGLKHRPHQKNRLFKPPHRDRILILKKGLTEEEAFRHEKYMIFIYGRKDNGTGILRNQTDGGEGISGYLHKEKAKRSIGDSNRGRGRSRELKQRIAASVAGYSWYNNGTESIQSRFHPGEGWVMGRLMEWETPRTKGMKWYHREGVRKMFREHPGDGWEPGCLEISRENNPTNRGKRWYNDGKTNKMFVDPPEGWTPGMIRR